MRDFQYISSALGLLLILVWFIYWYRNTKPVFRSPDPGNVAADRIVLAAGFVIALIAALVRAASFGVPDGVHGAQRFMTKAVVTGMAAFWFEVVVYGIVRAHRKTQVTIA